jgi:hypothetical protein
MTKQLIDIHGITAFVFLEIPLNIPSRMGCWAVPAPFILSLLRRVGAWVKAAGGDPLVLE